MEETVMECLQGYVLVAPDLCLQPPEEGAETSDLFITDLPGISLESIEKLASPEQKNFNGVWASVEKRALLKFRSAVLAELNNCFCISDITIVDCIVCANKALFANALWYLLGAELCYERLYSNAISRYTTIDKKDAEKLREDLTVDFQVELKNAVKGIDVQNSDCITEGLSAGGNVRYVETNDLC